MNFMHLFFAVLMFSFAALQWNDPDRLIWIGIYITTALMALTASVEVCKSCVRAWAIMLCIISLIMMAKISPEVFKIIQNHNYQEIFSTMSDDKPYIEQTREFLGLLIVLLYCLYVFFLYKKIACIGIIK